MSTTEFDEDMIPIGSGPMRQCISGFGRNTILAADDFSKKRTNGNYEQVKIHVDELVRWCRGLNREAHEARMERDAVTAERDRYEAAMRESLIEVHKVEYHANKLRAIYDILSAALSQHEVK